MNKKIVITSSLYISLVLIFMLRCFFTGNFEFLFYGTTLLGFWATIMLTEKRLNYPIMTLSLLIFWLALHLIGGTTYINGTRLYDMMLIPIFGEPYHVLKYDQAIHTLCYMVMACFIYVPISYFMRKDAPVYLVGIIVILSGSGIGAINEIIEFTAVVYFDAGETVGGYTNTAIDICANAIGSILGWFTLLPVIYKSRK